MDVENWVLQLGKDTMTNTEMFENTFKFLQVFCYSVTKGLLRDYFTYY